MDYAAIVAAIIAGGGGGALITAGWQMFIERKKLRRGFYEEQLRKLYGPLYYLISVNEKMMHLQDSHHAARKKAYFDGKEHSRDRETRAQIREMMEGSFKITSAYMDEVRKNNFEIKRILDSNYHFLDPEDAIYFVKFLQDFYRLQNEWDNEKGLKTDLDIYLELEKSIGEISFMDKDFAERVKERFSEKQNMIRKISYCNPKSLI